MTFGISSYETTYINGKSDSHLMKVKSCTVLLFLLLVYIRSYLKISCETVIFNFGHLSAGQCIFSEQGYVDPW